jgi:parallel beta-helix repeat protein
MIHRIGSRSVRDMFFIILVAVFLVLPSQATISNNGVYRTQDNKNDYNGETEIFSKNISYVARTLLLKFKSELENDYSNTKLMEYLTDIVTSDTAFSPIVEAKQIFSFGTKNKEWSKCIGLDRWVIIKLENDIDIYEEIKRYRNHPYIKYAEPNYIYDEYSIPNDPFFDDQWPLHNTGQTGGTPGSDIHAPWAWDIESGSPDVIVAVIDSGVDYYHPDLAGNLWINQGEDLNDNGVVDPSDYNDIDDDGNGYIDDLRGWDFRNNDNDPLDDSNHHHGTHCCGIVGAKGNNSIGVSGVCWYCTIMPVKAFGPQGGGDIGGLAQSIVYATDNNADVISMSWGGEVHSQIIKDAIDYADQEDVVLVAAVANDNSIQKNWPAGYQNVIAVTGTLSNDVKMERARYGNWIDIAAPGDWIYSTGRDNSYLHKSGTSMACPHVAGVAALLLSYNPDLSNNEIRNRIVYTGDAIDSLNPLYKGLLGCGRLNAFRALPLEHNVGVCSIVCSSPLKPDGESTASAIVENFGLNDETNVKVSLWINNIQVDEQSIPYFEKNSYQNIDFIWTTISIPGSYTLTVKVNLDDEIEVFYLDNQQSMDIEIGIKSTGSGDLYSSLQEAVDSSSDGDTIFVPQGSYHETVMLTKNISLQGEIRENTILDGSEINDILYCENVNEITISGFTIQHGNHGILLNSSSNIIISDNSFFGNTIGIICEASSHHNKVYYNNFDNSHNAFDDGSNTLWYNEYYEEFSICGGNFWSDYDGDDLYRGPNQDIPGSDGIGDVAYPIPGTRSMYDRYPLMQAWNGPHPAIVYVDDDNTNGPWCGTYEHPYKHIQDAVDHARDNDTIFVSNGTYLKMNIDKPLTLLGENQNSTVVHANADREGCILSANNVTVKGFTFEGGGFYGALNLFYILNARISENIFTNYQCAVCIRGTSFSSIDNNSFFGCENSIEAIYSMCCSHDNLIADNVILSDQWGDGIYMPISINCVVTRNLIKPKRHGIYLNGWSDHNVISENTIKNGNQIGILLKEYCDCNIISRNIITDHNRSGIYLFANGLHFPDGSLNNLVTENNVTNNRECGLEFIASNNNLVANNTIYNNRQLGIKLFDNSYYGISNDNHLFHNVFIGNEQNAYDKGWNNWDNGYPSGGNYWDDYGGIDDDGDGIGDDPYEVPGSGNIDHYPLGFFKNDEAPPIVDLLKPEKALYIKNYKIMPLFDTALIIGSIDIEVDAYDQDSDIEKIEFYIDNQLVHTDTLAPYVWKWIDRVFFKHTIKIVAYDTFENQVEYEQEIRKFF